MATTAEVAKLTALFWSRVDKRGPGECWPWTAGRSGEYGVQRVGPRSVWAHRLAYELLVGPIPDGLVIDHLCCNTRCVNPAHLEPVTNEENVRRGAIRRRRALGLPDEPAHGTAERYKSRRCRCDECREAWRLWSRERRRSGVVPPQGIHGASGYGNFGCRCDVCCAAIRRRVA